MNMKYYGIADISAVLSVLIVLYYIYGRKHKPSISDKYCSKLPDNMTPGEVNAFIHKNSTDSDAMASSILNLSTEGYIKFETTAIKGSFLNKGKIDIKILPRKNYEHLRDYDVLLMDFLNGILNSGYTIKDYCTYNGAACLDFIKEYKKCIKHSIKSSHKEYYEKPHKEAVSILLVISALNVLWTALSLISRNFKVLLYSIPCFLISLCGILLFERMSIQGVNSLYMWKAFRNYLKNISSMEKDDMPEVSVLEKYIAYAVALGVCKPVLKELPSSYAEAKEGYYSTWFDCCGYFEPIEDYDKIYEFIHALCSCCNMIFHSKTSQQKDAGM